MIAMVERRRLTVLCKDLSDLEDHWCRQLYPELFSRRMSGSLPSMTIMTVLLQM